MQRLTGNPWYPLIILLFCVGVFALTYEFGEMTGSPTNGAMKAAMLGATLGQPFGKWATMKCRRK